MDAPRGRGAAGNPPNRFEKLAYVPDPADAEGPDPKTEFLRDGTRSIIARNDSPDIGFEASINPYRGCETGCAYCYARPFHEYLGFSAGLDFETKILVKEEAPELLRRELLSPAWTPKPLAVSGVTDPYQPVERKLRLTRRCLEVLAEFRNPAVVITKHHLVTRDIDLLGALAAHRAALVVVTMTTLDGALARDLEPRAAAPARRLAAIRELAAAGIPVSVNVAPVIPGLTDHEMMPLLAAAAEAGAGGAGYTILRLPYAVGPLFEAWLRRHRPERAEKVLNRVREIRGGRLNDPRFHARMAGEGVYARQIEDMFRVGCRRAGLQRESPELSAAAFRRPQAQLELFG